MSWFGVTRWLIRLHNDIKGEIRSRIDQIEWGRVERKNGHAMGIKMECLGKAHKP